MPSSRLEFWWILIVNRIVLFKYSSTTHDFTCYIFHKFARQTILCSTLCRWHFRIILFPWVQFTIRQHCFRCGLGAKLGDVTWAFTHYSIVIPYGHIDLGQHWFRQWPVAWWHQAITWNYVHSASVMLCGSHLRAIWMDMLKISRLEMSLKMTNSILQPHLPGTNKLRHLFSPDTSLFHFF